MACSASPTPTVAPTSTSPPPAPTATQPPEPTQPATASATPQPEPSASATATAEARAEAAIYIGRPGPSSVVTSPVTVSGEADPTFEQNLVVEIADADGQVIASQATTIQADIGQRGEFSIEVPFSVEGEQPGRISVYDSSARDGGLISLASVEVTLSATNEADIQPAPEPVAAIEIRQPAPQAEVSGSQLEIAGYSDYFFESNLGVVLCGEGGSGPADQLCGTIDNRLAESSITIDSPDIGQPGPFSDQLSYSIEGSTNARLVVYAASPRDGGVLALSSVNITLLP